MRNHVYSGLVLLYMEKVEMSLNDKINSQYNQKEEIYRSILTLHSLLENPPGDFPANIREDTTMGFIRIFSSLRDEGKISRKLMECINTLLLKDGPNLGSLTFDIHNAVQQFVFRCWLTTHDRGLKDALILYARLQLNLTREVSDGSGMVEQLLDVVCKELDLISSPICSVPWGDATKDDKLGTLSGSQRGLVELAAHVLYRGCVDTFRSSTSNKRLKREDAASRLKDALMGGKWLWHATFCCLLRNYYTRISKDMLLYWFEGICTSFERIFYDANMGHSYDGLLWTLRSLQELSSPLLFLADPADVSRSSLTANEKESGWKSVWNCLMQGLPMLTNVIIVADAALVILGCILSSDRVNTCFIPPDVWDLRLFKRMPSVAALYFIMCYFSKKGSQGDLQDCLHLRKTLLRTVMGYLSLKGYAALNEKIVSLLPASVYALCAGCVLPFTCCKGHLVSHSFVDVTELGNDWLKTDEHEHERRYGLFECSVEVLAQVFSSYTPEASTSQFYQNVRLPKQLRDPLFHELEIYLFRALEDKYSEKRPLAEVFYTCALLSNFIYGFSLTRKREEVSALLSKTCQCLLNLLNHAVSIVQENNNDLQSLGCVVSNSELREKNSIITSFECFIFCPMFVSWRELNGFDAEMYDSVIQSLLRLLKALHKLYEEYSVCSSNHISEVVSSDLSAPDSPSQKSLLLDSRQSRIMDMELDVNEDAKNLDIIAVGGKVAVTSISFCTVEWKSGMTTLLTCFFPVLHDVTWDILLNLLKNECDVKVSEKILSYLCQHPHRPSSGRLADLVSLTNNIIETKGSLKLDCLNIVTALRILLAKLLLLGLNTSEKDIKSETEQCLKPLGDMVNKVSEFELLDWFGRMKLVECLCDFVLLNPQIGQTMIERLLMMLRDPDYRVRFIIARRIAVLFQTWDGHEELFQDVCLL